MTDLISRRAAIKAIHDQFDECLVWDESGECTANEVERVLDGLPIIEPKRGKWVDVMTEEWCTFDECKCSVCGVVEYFNKGWKKFSYCPNCGAKMFAKDIDVPNKEGAKNEAD